MNQLVKKILKNITVGLISLILLFVVLEITLRIIGVFAVKTLEEEELQRDNDKQLLIYAYGDSFTEGVGAADGHDYSAYLQKILKTQFNTDAKVVNRGESARNTAQMFQVMKEDLANNKPDIALILIGGANMWNHWGYKSINDEGSFWQDLAYRIRVFKFIKLLYLSIVEKKSVEGAEDTDFMEKELYDHFKQQIKNNPGNVYAYWEMGSYCINEGKYDLAIDYFKKGIKIDKNFAPNYEGVAYSNLQKRDYAEAEKWASRAASVDPTNPEYFNTIIASHICRGDENKLFMMLLKAVDQYPNVLNFYDQLYSMMPKVNDHGKNLIKEAFSKHENDYNTAVPHDFIHPYIKMGENINAGKKIDFWKWMEEDLIKIVNYCKKRGIQVILQTYPLAPWESSGNNYFTRVNITISQLASKLKVPLADHWQVLLKNFTHDQQKNFFLAQGVDNHPNQYGYEFMATYLSQVFVKNGIINADKKRMHFFVE